jgi:signal transduction histidine kinase
VGADHALALAVPDRGPFVDGVRDDLLRLTLNLVENALVHTPPGSEVRVALRPEGAYAVLEVADDGPGVPPDVRARIFDRFVRAGGEAGGGTGLGLAIVRAVAARHGGSVEVADGPAGGAVFTVRLPVWPVARAAAGHSPPRAGDRVV